MRKTSDRRLSLAIGWWLFAAAAGGFAVHASAGSGQSGVYYVVIAAAMAAIGAFGSVLCSTLQPLRRAGRWVRFCVLLALACVPLAGLLLLGLSEERDYDLDQALLIVGIFAVPAAAVAAVAEYIAHGGRHRRHSRRS